jgi:16S rRNA G527 N7-methylase RsmG
VNAEALQARGADLPRLRPAARGGFDLCVARAVAKASDLVRELAPLAAPGGHLLLMKGPNTDPGEIADGEREARRCGMEPRPTHFAEVPGLDRRPILASRRRV